MTNTGESQPSPVPGSLRRISDLPIKPIATAVPVTVATLDYGDSISEAYSLAVNEQAMAIIAEASGRFAGVQVRSID